MIHNTVLPFLKNDALEFRETIGKVDLVSVSNASSGLRPIWKKHKTFLLKTWALRYSDCGQSVSDNPLTGFQMLSTQSCSFCCDSCLCCQENNQFLCKGVGYLSQEIFI